MMEGFTIVSPAFLQKRSKDRIPRNTQKNTNWGVNTWNAWTDARNSRKKVGQMKLPSAAELKSVSPEELNQQLCFFVLEARAKNGKLYPGESLYNLMCGLARYLREDLERPDLNFMSTGNIHFNSFRKCLDCQMKLAVQQGIVTTQKKALPVSKTQEECLWEKGILNTNTAEGLSKAVYFYNCKTFGLRGRDEHRDLEVEQYSFGTDDDGNFLEFHGRTCKLVYGELVPRKIKPKQIKHYDNGKDLCVYNVFKRYIDIIGKSGYFYRKPMPSEQGDDIRFSDQRLPTRTLCSYMSAMMREAGFSGQYTSQSGKVTLATTLFDNGVDEQLIMERTGHRSKAVRCYKRASTTQVRHIGDMMDIQGPTTPKLPKPETLKSSDKTATGTITSVESQNIESRYVKHSEIRCSGSQPTITIEESSDEGDCVLLQENVEETDIKTETEQSNDQYKQNGFDCYYVHKKLRYQSYQSIHETPSMGIRVDWF